MATRVFRDFDEFAHAISGVTGRFVATERPEAEWSVQTVAVGRVIVQRVQTGCGAAFIGDGEEGVVAVGAPASAPRQIRVDGRELGEDALLVVGEGRSFTFSSRASSVWVGLAAPADHPDLPAHVVPRFEARGDRGPRTQSEPDYVAYARQTIQRTLAAVYSGDTKESAARSAVEEDLLRIVVHGLTRSSEHEQGGVRRSKFSRKRVIARTLELMHASAGQPLFLNDLCRATQVSERTLREIFHEYFGVGPMRLLKVNRLCEIRRVLLNADPDETKVREVAARFGVWDFSLFSRTYRELFGERPTDTLNAGRRSSRVDPALDETWIRYACGKFGDVKAVIGREARTHDVERASPAQSKTWSAAERGRP